MQLLKGRSDFLRNIVILATGTTVVQLINILLTPLLTRIYSPADFGVYGTYNSIISILMVVSMLKLELAIPIVEEKSVLNLMSLSFVVNAIFSLAVFVFIFILKFTFFNHAIDLLSDIWIIPISVFGSGIYTVFSYYQIRNKQFQLINKSLIYQSISKNVVQIALGCFKFGSAGLNLGLVGNYSAGIMTLGATTFPSLKENFKSKNFKKDLLSLLKVYKRFPLYLAPSGLLNAIGLYIPAPIIIWLYGKEVAGLYTFTVTIVSMPLRIVGTAIGQVFLGEIAEMYRNQTKGISQLYKKMLLRLTLISIPIIIIMELWGQDIFRVIFGMKWQEAGLYVQILIVGYALQVVSSPLSQIINILEKQNIQLQWDFSRVFFILSIFCSCYFFHLDIIVCLKLLCLSYVLTYIYLIIICWYYANLYDRKEQ